MTFRWLVLAVCALAGACGTISSRPGMLGGYQPQFEAGALLDGQAPTTDVNAEIAGILGLPEAAPSVWRTIAEFDARANADPARARALGFYLLDSSDAMCARYLNQAFVAQSTWRTSLTTAGTLFGAAGALAAPPRSAALLSGLAGAASGVRGNLDDGVLAGQAAYLIRSAVLSSQGERRRDLAARLASSNSSAANIAADVQVYHSRCALAEGIAYIAQNQPTEIKPPASPEPPPPQEPPAKP